MFYYYIFILIFTYFIINFYFLFSFFFLLFSLPYLEFVSGGIEELRVIVLDFNYINQLFLLPILNSIPKNSLHAITGNILGDGSLSLSRPDKGKKSIPLSF